MSIQVSVEDGLRYAKLKAQIDGFLAGARAMADCINDVYLASLTSVKANNPSQVLGLSQETSNEPTGTDGPTTPAIP